MFEHLAVNNESHLNPASEAASAAVFAWQIQIFIGHASSSLELGGPNRERERGVGVHRCCCQCGKGLSKKWRNSNIKSAKYGQFIARSV